jgi:hypothetical protein
MTPDSASVQDQQQGFSFSCRSFSVACWLHQRDALASELTVQRTSIVCCSYTPNDSPSRLTLCMSCWHAVEVSQGRTTARKRRALCLAMNAYPVRLNALGVLIDTGHRISAHCEARAPHGICGHTQQLDLEALAKRLGRDHGSLHADLAHKLRCSKCGSRGPIGLILQPPQKGSSNR